MTQVSKMCSSVNPFYAYGNTALAERLVGREREIDEITKRLNTSRSNISMVGETRIGKTSLITEVYRRLLSDQAHPVGWLDISTLPDSRELFREILDQILAACDQMGKTVSAQIAKIAESPCSTSYEAYRRCCRGLMLLAQTGLRCIVIIDEFDA